MIPKEIEELSVKWHRAIINDSEKTTIEARKIAKIINQDSRIKSIAGNPLLLTTLLFVKRWVGYLPTKKTVLYQEMIKLLLVTWNVEGHKQLDIDEAEPQLSYIAYWMTVNGQQRITEEDLRECLIRARKEMPEILGYTNISPDEFIKRVETRSSLLIMTGHKRLENGLVTQIYEFLHLSFQEYLTAKAIVQEYISKREANKSKLNLIKPYINNENWREVIPIITVLLGRDAKNVIKYLIEESKKAAQNDAEKKLKEQTNSQFAAGILGNCLANEIQITPSLLNKAITWFVRSRSGSRDFVELDPILNNKFGRIFRNKTKEIFFQKYDDKYAPSVGSALSKIYIFDNQLNEGQKFLDRILESIKSNEKEEKCLGILGLMHHSFDLRVRKHLKVKEMRKKVNLKGYEEIATILKEDLRKDDKHLQFLICWALSWTCDIYSLTQSVRQDFCDQLVNLWIETEDYYNLNRVVSWFLKTILTPEVSTKEIEKISQLEKILSNKYSDPKNEYDPFIATYLNHLLGFEVEQQVIKKLYQEVKSPTFTGMANFKRFCKSMGINFESLKDEENN